jgi:hypothetical protein
MGSVLQFVQTDANRIRQVDRLSIHDKISFLIVDLEHGNGTPLLIDGRKWIPSGIIRVSLGNSPDIGRTQIWRICPLSGSISKIATELLPELLANRCLSSSESSRQIALL